MQAREISRLRAPDPTPVCRTWSVVDVNWLTRSPVLLLAGVLGSGQPDSDLFSCSTKKKNQNRCFAAENTVPFGVCNDQERARQRSNDENFALKFRL
jgi:hypothetical protein